MATIVKLKSGNYRVQVRRNGQYASKTFQKKANAYSWSLKAERNTELGRPISKPRISNSNTFGDLIDLHLSDMREVKKPLRRTKAYSLKTLKKHLGDVKLPHLTREKIIVHGTTMTTQQAGLARIALRRLGLIGRSNERNRRPTQQELNRLINYFDNYEAITMPMSRIIKFAVATAMRQSEICNITWEDFDTRTRCIIVRDPKDPRHKDGNYQRVPIINLTGYDAWRLLEEQRFHSPPRGRIFPYNSKSQNQPIPSNNERTTTPYLRPV